MEDLNDELELAKIIRKMNSFLVIAEDQPTNSAPLSTICQVNVQNGNNNWTKIGEEETEIINGQMEEEEEKIIWVENGMEMGTELMKMNSSNGIGTKWHLEGQNGGANLKFGEIISRKKFRIFFDWSGGKIGFGKKD